MGQIGPKSCKFWYFQYILDFSEATRIFMGSVAYRFQEESEPVILSYFLWHFIVGQSLHMRQKLQNAPGGTVLLKYSLLNLGGRHDYNTTSHISTNIWNWKNLKFSHDQQTKLFNLSQRIGLKITSASLRLKSLKAIS